MDIEIISVGKLKEKYLKQGIQEYSKRLGPYCKLTLIELADEATADKMSKREIEQVLNIEAERIQKHLKADRQLIVMAIEGKLVSSEDMAQQLESYATYGKSKLTFVIGGSLGLADSIKRQAGWTISFGRITLPHQLMRLVLVEQIYRSFRIINNHSYHK